MYEQKAAKKAPFNFQFSAERIPSNVLVCNEKRCTLNICARWSTKRLN